MGMHVVDGLKIHVPLLLTTELDFAGPLLVVRAMKYE